MKINTKTKKREHILITGGAGYIGSLLCGELLCRGYRVTALDNLLFGGNSLLGYLTHPGFSFHKADVCDKDSLRPHFKDVNHVVHLAAIVGYPACEKAGDEASYRCNLEGTRNVFELAEAGGAGRFVFSSTYSNYGAAEDGRPVTEESPLYPQSIYAKTKIAAERYLLEQAPSARCAPVVFRFATLFGPSPRTRFDLIINQFVLEAIRERKLVIYQKDYNRSFVHIRDIIRSVTLALEAPIEKIRGQVFNVGSNLGNLSKEEIARLVQKYVPGVEVEYKDLSYDSDMRDVKVSFDKIERVLGYKARIGVEEGIKEMVEAIGSGLLSDMGVVLKNAASGD
ncbi:MAG: NAD(P)-dependent oxidoreductase [Candidatus Aminicenantes bacterium]|nr:NAD(P)-dependent oxidoreductase [Candidatus Aminicenantes bacterium]